MRNPISKKPSEMLAQAALLAKGADELGSTVELGQNSAAKIRDDMAAVLTAIKVYVAAAAELSARRRVVRQVARESYRFLMATRDSFKPVLGQRYNHAWNATGLMGSLKVPASERLLLPLLGMFRQYLLDHPVMETQLRDIAITAARAGELYTMLEAAMGEVNARKSVAKAELKNRNLKVRRLRVRIRGTIAALTQSLEPLDARWSAFGLNAPGQKARPDVPGKVSVVLSDENGVSVEWEPVARAEYYRLWKKEGETDAEMVCVGTSRDTCFVFEKLTHGTVMEVAVTAVNCGGESAMGAAAATIVIGTVEAVENSAMESVSELMDFVI